MEQLSIDFNKSICKDININPFCRMHWNGNDSSSLMFKLQNLKDRSLIKWAEISQWKLK